jgi:hypothetical protein
MAEVGKATLAVIPDASGFASKLSRDLDGPFTQAGRNGGQSISRGLNGNSSSFSSFGKKVGGLFAAGFAAIGVAQVASSVKDFIGETIGAASDLAETVSKSGQIFGDANGKVLEFAKGAATALGQSQQTALDGVSTFGIFANSAGLSADAAADFSIEMATLATDLASFNNTSPEEAIQAIGSALRGEAEPIRAYGVLLDDATLKNRAMALGLISTTKDALTPQQKVLSAHAEILAQTATQQGDFARTSDGLANKQRIFTAELENTKAEIGTALLPVVTDLFSTFSEVGVPALQDLAAWFTETKDTVRELAIGVVNGGLLMVEGFLAVGAGAMRLLALWTAWTRNLADGFFMVVRTIVDGAAQAFGWIPGLGPKLQTASDGLAQMQGVANLAFDSMEQSANDTADSFMNGVSAVDELRQKVLALNGTRATVTLMANGNLTTILSNGTSRSSGFNSEMRAGGGPVVAGRPYIVGENEAELFVPDRSGHIYNQRQLAAMGSSNSAPTFNINATADAPLAHRYAEDVARKTYTAWSDAVAAYGVGD